MGIARRRARVQEFCCYRKQGVSQQYKPLFTLTTSAAGEHYSWHWNLVESHFRFNQDIINHQGSDLVLWQVPFKKLVVNLEVSSVLISFIIMDRWKKNFIYFLMLILFASRTCKLSCSLTVPKCTLESDILCLASEKTGVSSWCFAKAHGRCQTVQVYRTLVAVLMIVTGQWWINSICYQFLTVWVKKNEL